MNKTQVVGSIFLALGMTSTALAQNDFYAGASIGQATMDGCDGLTRCDDEDTSWKVFGGWELNRNIAIEAAWVDLGEVSGSMGGSAASIEVDGWVLAGKGMLPINEQFGVFAKLGMIMWDAEGGGAASGIDDDGTDLIYGLGAQYMFTDRFGVVGEWEWYDIDTDVDLFSIGAFIKF
jgi:OOP family OmpA-OmpF porin